MGIVQRQGIKNTIVRFTGVLIGLVSMLYVYPLNDSIYGYAQFIYNTAYFLVPFMSLGALSLVIKYFPEFSKDDPSNRGFLYKLILLIILCCGVFLGIAYLFQNEFYRILDTLQMDVAVIRQNEFYILLLAFILIFIVLFTYYVSNYGKIVVPTLFQNFLFKLFLPAIVLAFVFERITEGGVALGMIIFFSTVLILMIMYTGRLKGLQFNWQPAFLTVARLKRMGSYMAYGAMNSMGGALAFRIDAIMITTLLSTTSTGIYFKILIMANIIDIPTQSIIQIAGPIISRSWEENDRANIIDIYKKSAVNLLIAGFGIFLVAWFTLDSLFQISINPDSFEGGKMIFLFIAIGKLLDMVTSVNGPIIVYSKLYRYNLAFIILLGVSNVVFNYFFIGKYDVMGAAIATCLALFLFNLVKFLFIWINFKMQPLSWPILKLIGIAALVFVVISILPEIENPFISIVVNGSITLGLYAILVYYLKISPEVNDLIHQGIRKITKRNGI